jgi:hypothetical protein
VPIIIGTPEKIVREQPIEGKGEGEIKKPEIGNKPNTQPTDKKSTGLKTKFLGLSVGGWIIIGLVLVWAGVTVGMIAGR